MRENYLSDKTDTPSHIKKRLSISMRRFVKGEAIKLDNIHTNLVMRYIALSRTDFREYLEYQFVEGMAWENYGTHWVIDHIAPLRLFDLHKDSELELCWHFLNLMPMWKADNKSKGDSIDSAKLELLRRLESASSSKIIASLLERVNEEQQQCNRYQYPLDFLRFYTRVRYHAHD
jgi:hypothetical protein